MGRLNIAIDGPAGAGKSTVAKLLAKVLDIYYLDTGAMYRAFAYSVMRAGFATTSREDVLRVLEKTDVAVVYENGLQKVHVNGEDVTDRLRTPEMGQGASDVAVFPEVRKKLVEIQRQVARGYDVVMDGRDIGTYVLPGTRNKFFLTASAAERAKRRHLELKEKGSLKTVEEIEREIAARDKNDSERAFAPLKMAEDAIMVDTTDMTASEAAGYIMERIVR